MKIENTEQVIFFLKIFLCSCFFAAWISCLTMLPESKNGASKIVYKNDSKNEKKNLESIRLGSEKIILDSSKVTLSTSELKEKKEDVIAKQVIKPQYIQKPIQKTNVKSILVKSKQKNEIEISKNINPKVKLEKSIQVTKIVVKDPVSKEIHLANKNEVKNAIKNGWNVLQVEKKVQSEKKIEKEVKVVENKAPENKLIENKSAENKTSENKNNLNALNFANLNFPTVAGATRKVLQSDMVLGETPVKVEAPDSPPSQLRKEVQVSVAMSISEELNATKKTDSLKNDWAPRYLVIEKKQLEKKVENLSENIDRISQEMEVTGFVENENGEKSVIIKDKANNKVVILNKGENYQGVLKVLDVNDEEVVLRSDAIEKNYIKKISKAD